MPLTALVLGCLLLAWLDRFVLDDAFISFRYAEHLVAGHGLVWNPGEQVEGYTNFLWTLLMALPLALGIDPVPASQALGLACFTISLVATWRAAHHVLQDPRAALWTTALLGTCYTFEAFATSGLETAMQAMWLCLATALTTGAWRQGHLSAPRAGALSLVLAGALLTRLDSVVLGLPLGVWALTLALRPSPTAGATTTRSLRPTAALLLPATLIVGAWLSWKLATYGELLPNTFYAKVADTPRAPRALRYLRLFTLSYLLAPFLIALPLAWRRLLAPEARPLLVFALSLLAWTAYLLRVGADFMEFRFMVPALPLLFLLIGWLCFHVVVARPIRLALLVTVLAGSLHHRSSFQPTDGIESVTELAAHLHRPVQDWEGIGRTLRRDLPGDGAPATVRIATSAAGAIPWYSKLPAVDMLGLTDPWIARHGKVFGAQLGHERVAPLRYLVGRGTHLVLGQPWLVRPSPPERDTYPFHALGELRTLGGEPASEFPPTSSLLEIPLDPRRSLVALYLIPHPDVEALVASGRWRRFRIVVPSPDATL